MPRIMVRFRHLFVALPLLLAVAPCRADDETLPESQKDIAVNLCSGDSAKLPACADGSLSSLARAADTAFNTALAKANAVTAVLFKRDQVWFGEIVELDAQNLEQAAAKEGWDKIAVVLQRRSAQLGDVAQGLGRAGVGGRWVNAFGTAEISATADDAFRVVLASETVYGPEDNQRQNCKASALVRLGTDGWLAGETDVAAAAKAPDGNKPARVKIRLQGQTLRVIAGDELQPQGRGGLDCYGVNQITGSYFPAGQSVTSGPAAAFTAPTFDCARPATASDEEICADPELAATDVRLNRAWKALLPRLDAATRRLLTEDQRAWVKTQAQRYPGALHPAFAKQSYFVHWTGVARDNLAQIQLERIALLEGFDETRRGFEGEWRAYNAQLSVTRDKDGKLHADGNKWFEDNYKGGCDYDFKGKAAGNVFKPDDTSKNPDSIERDHASLIVNRTDDEDVKHRFRPDGTATIDEGKCKRSLSISSTARLFPVKPSADSDTVPR